jgi:CheY-like chemotaxis protein/HPt (histidine-containing phosphotransfer) domain-containing protein
MNNNLLLNKRVLVAEDNSINQFVVKHSLEKLGATADIVGDGKEAVEKITEGHYDLVLMDIQMPEMDGYEAAQYIRNELQNTTPIIAMTAFAINGEDEKCIEAGMNAYIAKPFSLETLNETITKVLSSPAEINTNPYILTKQGAVVDISMLYEVASDDETYIQLMITTFLENMPNTLLRIEDAYNKSDYEQLYSAAHYAKSSLSVIKINEMLEWVREIENCAKYKTDLEILPNLIGKVKSRFAVARQILQSIVVSEPNSIK